MIITKLRKVEIHDLAELVQISSVISLAMDDSTDLKQDVMVSQLINLSINQSINQSIIQFLICLICSCPQYASEPETNQTLLLFKPSDLQCA